MARKRQKWAVGDLFLVPTSDGRFGVGQVIGGKAILNSVSIALFCDRCAGPDDALEVNLSRANAFSALFVTRDLLDSGTWQVVGNRPVLFSQSELPWEHTRTRNWVGAKVSGSANVGRLVNAYFGLAAWDDWHDPKFLDSLLLSPDRKPPHVLLKDGSRSK